MGTTLPHHRHLYMSGAELNQTDSETNVICQNPLYILANLYMYIILMRMCMVGISSDQL